MRFFILSLICIAAVGLVVAVFLRFVRYFDKKYEAFEDERFRAAAGPTELGEHPRSTSAPEAAEHDEKTPKDGGGGSEA